MVFPFCFILRAILFHSNELSAYFVETFDDATTLFRPRSLDAVSIMAELVLIDARNAADCSNRGIRGAHLQQGCSIQMVLEFVVAIAKPLRHLITISNHPFNMEVKGVAYLVNQFVVRFGSNNYCTRYILAQSCTIILVAPRDIYNYFFHIRSFFISNLPVSIYCSRGIGSTPHSYVL